MFEQEEWAANKTADDLSRKLFTKKKSKRKNEERGATKSAKVQKLDSDETQRQNECRQRKRKHKSTPDADNCRKKAKHQMTSSIASTDSGPLEDLKQHAPPQTKPEKSKMKRSKKSRTRALPATGAPLKTKSPRNKYKHLALKKQEKSEDSVDMSGKKNTFVAKKKESKKILSESENHPVIARDKLKKKKLKFKDLKAASHTTDKGEVAVKHTKRKRKRKKKNNPKKNKYRHLVLLKSLEQGAFEIDVDKEVGEQVQAKRPEKSVSPGKPHSFDVTKLKQALSTSVGKSENKQNKKSTESIPVLKKESEIRKKTEKLKDVKKTGATLKEKMTAKLTSARFRFLNEQLYTQTGQESYRLFEEDEEAFRVYHDGFQSQVEKWPTNPLDSIIKYINNKPASVTVADFGCGDARLAQSVPNEVHSFDLVAINDYVTPCDMAKVPLEAESVDICVFCLSLMGTNLVDYLTEANRVLKTGGILKIAEVNSRFESLPRFIDSLRNLGYSKTNQNTSNKMFVMLDFRKVSRPKKTNLTLSLKPCVYKRR